ncbi:adenine-specific methyltransferase EcoRI family protein [Chryseobacterium sp. EO14]|uniref:adenine-specific methyltransferase EcoRI family protein n=1 Tax=Chryseobacterium sp. EO14 TaxID=2950551 RepID=UPI00210D18A9|nr:adenine-specific methyltransferase EcoRI family protein [Chryseobacterium sp. EO14]MCQ4138613.1 adenine-specific methyltransferase EcoRI family protein [Chryseobacterium sp. EO14]
MANSNLSKAKNAKNDEFYTQYQDIEKEIMAYLDYDPNTFTGKTVLLPCDDPEWSNFTKFFAQNFERLGLKKLISTSYAPDSKKLSIHYQPTLFETTDPQYDKQKTIVNGKIFTLTHDKSGDGKIDVNDLEWTYLKGDGDFRSAEIKKLRDEADIIITNPPFSLFREFVAWIIEAEKKFVIIGNMNAITYKEIFPLIKENNMWLGNGFKAGNAYFSSPTYNDYADGVFDKETGLVKFRNCVWFTNIDHGRRHQPLSLMTMTDNLRFNKKIKEFGYQKYDNYDAIDIPFTDAIPSDYEGVMGVPISFLDKYCPEQFEIIWRGGDILWAENECPFFTPPSQDKSIEYRKQNSTWRVQNPYLIINNKAQTVYQRILIKHKK